MKLFIWSVVVTSIGLEGLAYLDVVTSLDAALLGCSCINATQGCVDWFGE